MKFECYLEDIRACLRNYGVEQKLINNMTDYELLEAETKETEKELDEFLEKVRRRHS